MDWDGAELPFGTVSSSLWALVIVGSGLSYVSDNWTAYNA